MGTMWLYAISVEDVREFFGAPEMLGASLLASANDVVREPEKPPLIGKVGPLLRHPITPLVEVPVPTMEDARAMVEGRALPPERLGVAWVIVRHWCAVRCRDSVRINVSRDQLATLDFAHVASGLSSQYSFGTVLSRDPYLPLMPVAGLTVGWMPNMHLRRMCGQWSTVTAASTGAPVLGSTNFSRDDPTGVGLTWPLRDTPEPTEAWHREWDQEWRLLDEFFKRAAEWSNVPEGLSMLAPDVLAMYQ